MAIASLTSLPYKSVNASLGSPASRSSPVVTAVAGDAFKEVPKLAGPLDFVFVDAWKPDYKKYFDMVFPKLAPGGLLLAHNVRNKATEMQPFLSAIEGHPDLLTTIVSPSSEGMSVSWKRR